MAYKGFDIAYILPSGVTLNILPCKGERAQSNLQETDETARIAAVKTHVERAIGRIKNYHMLDGNNDTFDESSIHSLQLFGQFLPPIVPSSGANAINV